MPAVGAFAINRYSPVLLFLLVLVFSSKCSFGGKRGDSPICFLRFADVGLCVQAVVAVHFDLNRIRLERLFSIFFLQR